jgi:hypothetical protein
MLYFSHLFGKKNNPFKGPWSFTFPPVIGSLRTPTPAYIIPLFPCSAYFSTLMMEATDSSKMFINFYYITQLHIPEES